MEMRTFTFTCDTRLTRHRLLGKTRADLVQMVLDARDNLDRVRNDLDEARQTTATLMAAGEYHEDMGTVLWWHLPICEPPCVGAGPGAGEKYADGTPTMCARLIEDGWLTHFTKIAEPKI
jgi:hypothetical protein